jgi:Cof subfamily protein (haloacid dehalogenase superfamily)
MDHTLLTEKGELPPNLNDYISELDKLNIDFVAASGRPLYTLENIFSTVKHKMSFISDNGGAITYRGRIIFKSLLKPSDYQQMFDFTEEKSDGIAILCGLDSAFLSENYKSYENYLRTFYSKITFAKDIKRLNVNADKFTVFFPQENSKERYETIFNPQYGKDFSVTVGDSIWIDIMNPGVDKGQAMRFLGKELGLKAEQMAAFGDTYNDIEMLKYVKYSYIVSNASPDMKQYANFIADSNDNFGVLKIIDKIIQSHKPPILSCT